MPTPIPHFSQFSSYNKVIIPNAYKSDTLNIEEVPGIFKVDVDIIASAYQAYLNLYNQKTIDCIQPAPYTGDMVNVCGDWSMSWAYLPNEHKNIVDAINRLVIAIPNVVSFDDLIILNSPNITISESISFGQIAINLINSYNEKYKKDVLDSVPYGPYTVDYDNFVHYKIKAQGVYAEQLWFRTSDTSYDALITQKDLDNEFGGSLQNWAVHVALFSMPSDVPFISGTKDIYFDPNKVWVNNDGSPSLGIYHLAGHQYTRYTPPPPKKSMFSITNIVIMVASIAAAWAIGPAILAAIAPEAGAGAAIVVGGEVIGYEVVAAAAATTLETATASALTAGIVSTGSQLASTGTVNPLSLGISVFSAGIAPYAIPAIDVGVTSGLKYFNANDAINFFGNTLDPSLVISKGIFSSSLDAGVQGLVTHDVNPIQSVLTGVSSISTTVVSTSLSGIANNGLNFGNTDLVTDNGLGVNSINNNGGNSMDETGLEDYSNVFGTDTSFGENIIEYTSQADSSSVIRDWSTEELYDLFNPSVTSTPVNDSGMFDNAQDFGANKTVVSTLVNADNTATLTYSDGTQETVGSALNVSSNAADYNNAVLMNSGSVGANAFDAITKAGVNLGGSVFNKFLNNLFSPKTTVGVANRPTSGQVYQPPLISASGIAGFSWSTIGLVAVGIMVGPKLIKSMVK